jgi:hypothetical protein
MRKLTYSVEWEGDITNYKQDFETIQDARIALVMHRSRNAVMKIIILKED